MPHGRTFEHTRQLTFKRVLIEVHIMSAVSHAYSDATLVVWRQLLLLWRCTSRQTTAGETKKFGSLQISLGHSKSERTWHKRICAQEPCAPSALMLHDVAKHVPRKLQQEVVMATCLKQYHNNIHTRIPMYTTSRRGQCTTCLAMERV